MKKPIDIDQNAIKEMMAGEVGDEPGLHELRQTEAALLDYAKAFSTPPPVDLREQILTKLNKLERQKKGKTKLDPGHLPMLDPDSNWMEWQAFVDGIEPPAEFENIHLHTLVSDEKRELFVAWVKEMVEEEVHFDILESFLLLEGSCECHIANEKGETRIVRMSQGDHITMQLGETHDIVITSVQPAKAILEWRKIAA